MNEKGEIRNKEEKSRLPVDMRGSKTSVLKLPITNSQTGQLPVGLIAQLVEHCTGIADVMGLNPFKFFSGFNFVAA